MDWRLKFKGGLSKHDQEKFSCMTEVNIQHNERVSIFYGECFYANNKKEARHIASLFCLAEIYAKVEGAFEEFENARKEKPTLQQPLYSDNRMILASR